MQDEIAKLEEEMDERHAAEIAALERREREAAGPQEEATNILATDLYSFSLPPSETTKQVLSHCHWELHQAVPSLHVHTLTWLQYKSH